jgi:hypothetical protein
LGMMDDLYNRWQASDYLPVIEQFGTRRKSRHRGDKRVDRGRLVGAEESLCRATSRFGSAPLCRAVAAAIPHN